MAHKNCVGVADSESIELLMGRPPSHAGEGPEADGPGANPSYIGTDLAAQRAKDREGDGGGEGEPPGGLIGRVVHLELRMGSVEGKLDTVIERLGGIATRTEMRNYLLLAVGLFVAVASLLIAGMGWLETRAARVQPVVQANSPTPLQPIIIQVPYPARTQNDARSEPPQQNSN